MEELKNDVKKAGRKAKEKAKEKVHDAGKFISEVREKDYTFSGDVVVGAVVAAVGALATLTGKVVSLSKKNERIEKELSRKKYENGVFAGRVSELRFAEIRRRKEEREKENSQE